MPRICPPHTHTHTAEPVLKRSPAAWAAAGSCPPPDWSRVWSAPPSVPSSRLWPRRPAWAPRASRSPPPRASSCRGKCWQLGGGGESARDVSQNVLKVFLLVFTAAGELWYALVSTVLLLHCSSTPPCFLPDSVYGVSNTKRLMLWHFSKSVFFSGASFSSKYGLTKVTWT